MAHSHALDPQQNVHTGRNAGGLQADRPNARRSQGGADEPKVDVHQIFDRDTSTYTYLVVDRATHDAALIDPVFENIDRDLNWVDETGAHLKYVMDTHVHADHTTASGVIAERLPQCESVAGPHGPDCATKRVRHHSLLKLGESEIESLETPGHTDSCMSYKVANNVFTGDALLVRGCGRTDFQNGSPEQLYDSVTQVLFELPDDTVVYTGHDYRGFTHSTIGDEKHFNPRLAHKTKSEFVNIMNGLHLDMPKRIKEAVPANKRCGKPLGPSVSKADAEDLQGSGSSVQPRTAAPDQGKNNGARVYADFVRSLAGAVPECSAKELVAALDKRREKRVHVFDIRDDDELSSTGTVAGSLAIPRAHLEQSIGELVTDADDRVVLVCRSGNRSMISADVLRRMGYKNATSLRGGVVQWKREGFPLLGTNDAALSEDGRWSWEAVRSQYRIVSRRVPVLGGERRVMVYLDHAASTQPSNRVLDKYHKFMAEDYANIHRGTYLLSRGASESFDECYGIAADFIGGNLEKDCVVFMSNTTQAIDLCSHVMSQRPGKVIVTELEHHSNDLPHRSRGDVLRARMDRTGRLDMGHMAELLEDNDVKLVAVSGGSNCTGWMPDIHQIACMAHEHGARILVDAAQLLAHHPIDVKAPGALDHIDFLAAAGHKAYAPLGSAFLYGPRDVMDAAPPYIPGGGTASCVKPDFVEFVASPDRHQGGTPNIGGVVAFGEAMKFLGEIGMNRVREHELQLIRKAVTGLSEMHGVTLYGPNCPDERLAAISFNIDGVGDLLGAAILSEEYGIACRNGRFCSHIQMNCLLQQQGGAMPDAGPHPGAMRASFGVYNTEADVDALLAAVRDIRDKKWKGIYQVKGSTVSSESAARCNDAWMEVSPAPE
jgi:cysteine desulfurase / selenocysteine lyase